MELWMDLLFGNWVGLLSVLVIAFVIGIGIFFVVYFLSKSRPPAD